MIYIPGKLFKDFWCSVLTTYLTLFGENQSVSEKISYCVCMETVNRALTALMEIKKHCLLRRDWRQHLHSTM